MPALEVSFLEPANGGSAVAASAKADFGFFAARLVGLPRRSSDVYPPSVWRVVYRNEDGSIKNIKLCKTKPISRMPKMVVTAVYTMTNNNEQRTANYSKQTQTNPILPTTPFGGQTQSYPLCLSRMQFLQGGGTIPSILLQIKLLSFTFFAK